MTRVTAALPDSNMVTGIAVTAGIGLLSECGTRDDRARERPPKHPAPEWNRRATSEHPSSPGNSDAPRVTRRYRDMRGGGNIIGAAPRVPGTKMLRCNDFGVREPSSAHLLDPPRRNLQCFRNLRIFALGLGHHRLGWELIGPLLLGSVS